MYQGPLSGSGPSYVCKLLPLLLVLCAQVALAQDDCKYGSSNWPDCLGLGANRLNRTYCIKPDHEDSEDLHQDCQTLSKLQQNFFACNGTVCQTVLGGNTTIMFLPGTHTLSNNLQIFGNSVLFSLLGNASNMTASIDGGAEFYRLKISKFRNSTVAIRSLHFHNVLLRMINIDFLELDSIVLNNSMLFIDEVKSATITDCAVNQPSSICNKIDTFAVFSIRSSADVSLNQITFQGVPSFCKSVAIRVSDANLSIFNGQFQWESFNYIYLSQGSSLTVSGIVEFVNGAPAILALSSEVILAGNVTFINNTALGNKNSGGAINLRDSFLTIADNANVTFQGNFAGQFGGAIFSSSNEISSYVLFGNSEISQCLVSFSESSSVKFIDNSAGISGSALYGITLSKMACLNDRSLYDDRSLHNVISIEPDSQTAVSSDPLRVCICPYQSTPDCLAILPEQNITHLHYTVHPGQIFTISAAVVGFNFALTSGSVHARFGSNSTASFALELMDVQDIPSASCTNLTYRIYSNNSHETLVLTVDGSSIDRDSQRILEAIELQNNNAVISRTTGMEFHNDINYFTNGKFAGNLTDSAFRLAGYGQRLLQTTHVKISVAMRDCPPGFKLDTTLSRCVCSEEILKLQNQIELGIMCDDKNLTIYSYGVVWVTEQPELGIVAYRCPLSYCRITSLPNRAIVLDLTNPDTQCNNNRSGFLCGSCQKGLSMVFGSSRCLHCSNIYLLLIIPFAVAGIVLVFIIKILNLTVSVGTLNGLFFYANIISTSGVLLLGNRTYYNYYFAGQFISWMNLDLGIETCFYNGMDAYAQTWLEYVFPLYVLLITVGFYQISKYSKRAKELFGGNAFSVMSTLLFLYNLKLIQLSATNIGFSGDILTSYPHSLVVWSRDGNVEISNRKYAILLFTTVLTTIVVVVPWGTTLLCAPCLRKWTYIKHLQWLKPVLDAVIEPFSEDHRSWVGFLVYVRTVLYIIFASVPQPQYKYIVLTAACLFLLLIPAITGKLYKKWYLNVLETTFYLNLGILAATIVAVQFSLYSINIATLISVIVGFLVEIAILIFHTVKFVIQPLLKRCKTSPTKAVVEVQGSEDEQEREFYATGAFEESGSDVDTRYVQYSSQLSQEASVSNPTLGQEFNAQASVHECNSSDVHCSHQNLHSEESDCRGENFIPFAANTTPVRIELGNVETHSGTRDPTANSGRENEGFVPFAVTVAPLQRFGSQPFHTQSHDLSHAVVTEQLISAAQEGSMETALESSPQKASLAALKEFEAEQERLMEAALRVNPNKPSLAELKEQEAEQEILMQTALDSNQQKPS